MLAGVAIFGTPLAMKAVTTSTWLLAVALLGPLLSLAAVGLAVMISSRVNDTRVAQQAAGLLVLPLVGIFVAQLAGWVLIDTRAILSSAVVLLAADIAILLVAERLFQRERILTQWR